MFSKSSLEFCLILRIYRWMMITIGEIETLIEIMAEIDMTEIEMTGIGMKMIVTDLMMIDVASEITAMTTTETLVIKIIRIQSAKKEKEAIITATTTTIWTTKMIGENHQLIWWISNKVILTKMIIQIKTTIITAIPILHLSNKITRTQTILLQIRKMRQMVPQIWYKKNPARRSTKKRIKRKNKK